MVIKIDTEGNELNVLRGASSTLRSTDFVILEVSIAERFKNSYQFEDLVSIMGDNGFSLFSILSISHPENEIRPRFLNVVFSRKISNI